ncbi:hypothetical protein MWU58_03210 [Flavobacteriaceae bacterium S0825]|uniref:hypothetical protein n=1 Tax=Gaetbulibacter sp. S0825 TaxID=2720084 RepID=UPI00143090B1|nr:hypothetical protein [Gaetbulibacter sp. S0825]MCK0108287.1 hypothetical protein [Flavobacteriaceae bacterium S0825]NIX63923.1 hypothetical protein [Gaetbulibacter sp. S0825]
MKLLFIENRYKTFFFDLVATKLEKHGHDIYWIVQNPNFIPTSGKIITIKYPPKSVKVNKEVNLDNILISDRQLNYFKKEDTSYFYYYYQEIKNIIQEIKPNFVFGESTVFHELLTIKICKEKDILYLHPSSCRYPSGRFSFYLYDTVYPYLGSENLLSQNEALSIIDNIVKRHSKPDYMKKVSFKKSKVLKDKAKILKGYITGEKYNTPNPIVKYKIEKQKEKNKAIWNEKAVSQIDKNVFSIVYPLHLQPEANIDVWGRPRRDQLESIQQIANNLKHNQVLYIKPNPKSKYELSKELLSFIDNTPNTQMLHHQVSMDEIFIDVNLFITVNGTIALECIFANKPILTLVEVFFNKAKNCLFMNGFDLLQDHIIDIQKNNFPILSQNEKIDFLNLLNTTSFMGVISDPYYSAYSVSKQNVKDVTKAFESIVKIKT